MVEQHLEATSNHGHRRSRRWTQVTGLVVVVLCMGMIARLYQPGYKVYWFDETMTSLRISGYTQAQLVEAVVNQPPMAAGEFLQRYQYPNRDRTWTDTLDALKTHPEHSPLYYVLARQWLQMVGHSVGGLRLLSVLFGLLTLPAVYWLGRELFAAAGAGWAIAAMVAGSPLHVLYAQEARQYSLWTLAIALSSAALLRAHRRNTTPAWSLYGLTLALGLYSHIFHGLVAISHGLWLVAVERGQLSRKWLAYGGSAALGLALFAPWLVVLVNNWGQLIDNTAVMTLDRQGILPLFWLLNLSRLFFDLNQGPSAINPAHYLLLALCGYGLWHLYRQGPRPATLFILTLLGVTAIALIGSDLLLGGRRSTIARYPIPCYLGLQVTVGYLFWHLFSHYPPQHPHYRRGWRGAIALAVAAGLSLSVSAHHALWWNKSYAEQRFNPAIATLINPSDRPLMITDRDPSEVLAFIHRLDPDVQVQWIARPNAPLQPPDLRPIVPEIPPNTYSDIFLYNPSDGLRRRFARQGLSSSDISGTGWLWRVTDAAGTAAHQSPTTGGQMVQLRGRGIT
jgi:uncharacterized membrane protein